NADNELITVDGVADEAECEGTAKIATANQVPRSGNPGDHSGPAKPQQCQRCDVFRYPGPTGTAFVRSRIGQAGDLYGVEVIQQTDPHDAGQIMQPARQREFVPPRAEQGGNSDCDNEACGNRALNGIQRIHLVCPNYDDFMLQSGAKPATQGRAKAQVE